MNRIFEDFFEREQKLHWAFDEALELHFEAGKKAVQERFNDLIDEMGEYGEEFRELYLLYYAAQVHNNSLIDLHENYHEEDIKPLIDSFREFGVEQFTFGSEYTGAVNIAGEFVKNGCSVEGIAYINAFDWAAMGDVKKPAYLFRVRA